MIKAASSCPNCAVINLATDVSCVAWGRSPRRVKGNHFFTCTACGRGWTVRDAEAEQHYDWLIKVGLLA